MSPGTDGSLTRTPQNVLVLKGQDANLLCSTDGTSRSGQNPIEWKYDGNIISYIPCISSRNSGFVAFPPNSSTDCNLRALASNELGISGVYRCEETGARSSDKQAVATVVVLGELSSNFY